MIAIENIVDTGSPSTDSPIVTRLARLHHLVGKDGWSVEAAAQEVGIDPIIAQLWLRLPQDCWPQPLTSAAARQTRTDQTTARLPVARLPEPGQREVLTCRLSARVHDQLRSNDRPLLEAADAALQAGLAVQPSEGPLAWPPGGRQPFAFAVSAETHAAVCRVADSHFGGDLREAAGWLITRGAGMPLMPPDAAPGEVPDGATLRAWREAAGLSQRQLADAARLSRGLLAGIERGERRLSERVWEALSTALHDQETRAISSSKAGSTPGRAPTLANPSSRALPCSTPFGIIPAGERKP